MTRPTTKRLNQLPLYADDRTIGAAILGADEADIWCQMAPLLEREGLPKIDERYGKRYVPGVKFYYDKINGLPTGMTQAADDGAENPEIWTRTSARKRRG